MRARAFRLAAGLLALLACCVVDDVRPEGRPCTANEHCGPGTVCGPQGKCVAKAPDATADLRVDLAVPDQTVPDQMSPDRGPDGPPDADHDGIPDIADNCPNAFNQNQADDDGDKLGNVCDNCPTMKNAGQEDLDGDKTGDLCDTDVDGDTLPNPIDPNPTKKDTVYYYPVAGTQLADFTVVAGWSASGAQICKSQPGTADTVLMLEPVKLSQQKDYFVQAKLTTLATSGNVSVVFRVAALSPQTSYHCRVDLANKRLELGRYVSGTWTLQKSSLQYAVPGVSGTFVLRATAKGSSLTCTEVQSSQSVTDTDGSISTGSAGFGAYQAQACFDYLMVIGVP